MNTTATTTRTTTRLARWCRRFVAVAAMSAVGFTAVGNVGSAAAWSYGVSSNRPGAVSVSNIYVGDLLNGSSATQFTLYGNTNVVAYRSPGSTGQQLVMAQYVVQQYVNGQWVAIATSPVMSGYIGARQASISFAKPNIRPSVARGYFRMAYWFAWSDSAGRALGSVTVLPNLSSDHVCATQLRLCQSGAGYVRTGGYRTNTW